MTDRVMALIDLAADSRAPSERLLERMEDTLSEGYGLALAGDAESMRAEEHLHEIINDMSSPARGATVRAIATEHALLEHDIIELRRRLAELRRQRDRLHAASHAASA